MDKKYYECAVVTKKDINIKEIEELLERNTWSDPEVDNSIIPARKIECFYRKPFSNRVTHYKLTKKEIKKLRKDPRILCIDIIENKDNSEKEYTTTANFTQYIKPISGNPALYITNNIGSTDLNELITYHSHSINLGSYSEEDALSNLNNNRKGKHVDIVISENGGTNTVNWLSPMFLRPNGSSRVINGIKKFIDTMFPLGERDILNHTNFNTTTGAAVNLPFSNFSIGFNHIVNDCLEVTVGNKNSVEHGQGVASTAAGNIYGYAFESDIISVTDGDFPNQTLDAIQYYHTSKSINNITGRKNPTIFIRSVGGSQANLVNNVLTSSIVSASFDLDSFLEPNNGFRINYAGHDLVFTSGSSEDIETKYNKKLGGNIYEYSCKDPQLFINKINDAQMVSNRNTSYNHLNFDNPLSMFSASYNSGIFSITSSFGLPSNVRIYSGTLAQLTGSETPSGGYFLTKLTGSRDAGWHIKDWAPNGSPLNLGGKNTYPKPEYGLNIRAYDHHGIENESIYAWHIIWTDGSVGTQATNESNLRFRRRLESNIIQDDEMSDAGIILVNSAGNSPVWEHKSASLTDTYYRPEYNIPSSHPYHTYFISGKDVGTAYFEDDEIYINQHHNSPSVIDVGNYDFGDYSNTTSISNIRGSRGNNIDIFAPGSLNIAQYFGSSSSNSSLAPTSSFFTLAEDFPTYLVTDNTNPTTLSNVLNDFTQSVNDNLLSLNNTLITQSKIYAPNAPDPTTYDYSINPVGDNQLQGVCYNTRISSFGGTSGAAPIVGGLLALYLEKNPTANVIDCKNYLRDTASVSIINNIDSNKNNFYYFQYDVQNGYTSSSINNGLVIEHPFTGSIWLNNSPNRILYNAEFNKKYRNTFNIKGGSNLKLKGNINYNGEQNKFTIN